MEKHEKMPFAELREMFVRRMTLDTENNSAVFGVCSDGSTYLRYHNTGMDMVLRCFDDAVVDWKAAHPESKILDTPTREG